MAKSNNGPLDGRPVIRKAKFDASKIKQFPGFKPEVEIRTIDGEAAANLLLKHNTFEGQRASIRNRVGFFILMALRGMFMPLSQLTFFEYRGARVLLNGQNRLEAIARANATIDMLFVTYKYVGVMSGVNDARKLLYSMFDGPGGRRKPVDYLIAAGVPGTTSLDSTMLGRLMAACRITMSGFSSTRKRLVQCAIDALVDETKSYLREAEAFVNIVSQCTLPDITEKVLYCPALFSTAIVTFRAAPRRAKYFWEQVMGVTHATGAAAKLQQHVLKFISLEPSAGYYVRGLGVIAAHCWNKFYDRGRVTVNLTKTHELNELLSDYKWKIHGSQHVEGRPFDFYGVPEEDILQLLQEIKTTGVFDYNPQSGRMVRKTKQTDLPEAGAVAQS